MIGADVHPGATAGDGKTIEQSKYIKETDRLDNVIQCAQCGMYVDLNRRATGNSLGAIGSATGGLATITPPNPGVSTVDNYADPVDTNAGCPFCNSLNPRGKYRDKIWGTGFSVENL